MVEPCFCAPTRGRGAVGLRPQDGRGQPPHNSHQDLQGAKDGVRLRETIASRERDLPETGANHIKGGGIYLRREPIASREGEST
eukprot:1150183-Prorocentrum_minimum.AAC.1